MLLISVENENPFRNYESGNFNLRNAWVREEIWNEKVGYSRQAAENKTLSSLSLLVHKWTLRRALYRCISMRFMLYTRERDENMYERLENIYEHWTQPSENSRNGIPIIHGWRRTKMYKKRMCRTRSLEHHRKWRNSLLYGKWLESLEEIRQIFVRFLELLIQHLLLKSAKRDDDKNNTVEKWMRSCFSR